MIASHVSTSRSTAVSPSAELLSNRLRLEVGPTSRLRQTATSMASIQPGAKTSSSHRKDDRVARVDQPLDGRVAVGRASVEPTAPGGWADRPVEADRHVDGLDPTWGEDVVV